MRPRFILRLVERELFLMIAHQYPFHMDFFYHYPSITTQVSVDVVEDHEPNPLFFDCVNVGSEDLKRLFPGPPSSLTVSITPDLVHPAFPPTGLTCWVVPHDSKVRQETLINEPPEHNLTRYYSMDVPCVFPPLCSDIWGKHHSRTSHVKFLLFQFCP